jgi:hypothetical protein
MADRIDINTCTDTEELTKLLGKVNNVEKRKAIRARMKELREIEDKQIEERRQKREAQSSLDSVKQRAQQAEEERARKLKGYQEMAKTSIAASSYDPVKEKHNRSVEDRAAEMKHFDELAKGTSIGELQGGLEKLKQIEYQGNEKQRQNLINQFDNLQTNYTIQKEKEAISTKGGPPA